MIRMELRFDEEKAAKYGYSHDDLFKVIDSIFAKEHISKIAEGIYEDKKAEDSTKAMRIALRLYKCPIAVHFCNYWNTINPDDGDCGDEHLLLEKRRKDVPICLAN